MTKYSRQQKWMRIYRTLNNLYTALIIGGLWIAVPMQAQYGFETSQTLIASKPVSP